MDDMTTDQLNNLENDINNNQLDLEEVNPVDGSFLDVSVVEEVETTTNEFQCDTCQKVFKRKQHLARHLKSHDPNCNIRCSDCNVYFKSQESLEEHNSKKHSNMVCDTCGVVFKRRRDMIKHQQIHGGGGPQADESVKRCPYKDCNKVFNRLFKYQYHINKHTKSKPYECNTCKKVFCSKYVRNDHQKVCSQSRKITCNICNKEFQHRASLRNHKVAEHTMNWFKCECGASYKYKAGLSKHKKSKKH